MRFLGLYIYIYFCIAEYRGTQDMYLSCIFFDIYIFMHMDALFVYDVLSFVRTWMRLMMCCMFVFHVDASSLGCWARGCPLCILCDAT